MHTLIPGKYLTIAASSLPLAHNTQAVHVLLKSQQVDTYTV